MKSKTCARAGIMLIEQLVVIAIIAFLAAMLLPPPAKAKAGTQEINCVASFNKWGWDSPCLRMTTATFCFNTMNDRSVK